MQRLVAPHPIKGTDDTAATTIESMRVDHGRADIGMAEKLLHRGGQHYVELNRLRSGGLSFTVR